MVWGGVGGARRCEVVRCGVRWCEAVREREAVEGEGCGEETDPDVRRSQ